MDIIGGRLREERERLGLNQTDFAGLAGTTKRGQIRYESGERRPDIDYLAAIAKSGADVLYIVTGRHKSDLTSPLQPELLRDVIEGVEEHLQGMKRRLAPDKRAELITLLYERFAPVKKVEKTTIERMLRLVA